VKIIDTHVHVVVGNPDYHNPQDFPVELLIERMDEAGVSKAVVVQSRAGNGLDDPYPTESARLYPTRLIAVCGGDPRSPGAAETLRERVTQWGARGARIFCDGLDPGDARYNPVWEAAADLEAPILLAGKVDFDTLGPLLRRFPELKIVIDHLGKPDLSRGVPAGLARLADHRGVVVKFSSYVIDQAEKAGFDVEQLFSYLVETFGADRMVWGSNYPSSHEPRWTYRSTVETLKSLVEPYDAAVQERILSGTALALWPDLENGPGVEPLAGTRNQD
jgi:L-fuconolactonase